MLHKLRRVFPEGLPDLSPGTATNPMGAHSATDEESGPKMDGPDQSPPHEQSYAIHEWRGWLAQESAKVKAEIAAQGGPTSGLAPPRESRPKTPSEKLPVPKLKARALGPEAMTPPPAPQRACPDQDLEEPHPPPTPPPGWKRQQPPAPPIAQRLATPPPPPPLEPLKIEMPMVMEAAERDSDTALRCLSCGRRV